MVYQMWVVVQCWGYTRFFCWVFDYLSLTRVLRQPALEKAKEMMQQPMDALNILVWGGDHSALHQAIHETFFSFPFQAIVWVAYGYIVSGFFKKKIPVKKQEAASYGSHGTARWANKKEYTQV